MTRQYTLLGKLNIEENGRLADVMKSPITCGLLAYLIVTNQEHSRGEIADLLWDTGSTTQGLTRLRVLLGRIKKMVPELVVTRKHIAFSMSEYTAVDYFALIEGLQSESPEVIENSLQLYRGELLSGFYLPDAAQFNEWLLIEREQLRHKVHDSFQKLCVIYAQDEAWEQAAKIAQQWLSVDPLDEEALRHVMQNLANWGHVSAALHQYEQSCKLLWQELEVEPEEATRELAAQLENLRADSVGSQTWVDVLPSETSWPERDAILSPGPLPPKTYLPFHRNNDFTGRQETLAFLADQLQVDIEQDDLLPKITAITGMGGVGKTQLAVEYCYRYGRFYPGGVYWMSFAQADNIPEEAALIGGNSGMELYQEVEQLTRQEQVARVQKAWQEPIPRLLVFDNCEAEDLLTKWVPKTGGCRILLTSRRGYWSRELRVKLRPLPPLEQEESITLLTHLVPAMTQADARDIANELGHLPLALHLAGSFLNQYQQTNPQQYLQQIRATKPLTHPSLSGQGVSHSPTGHELNVLRTFSVSLGQLDLQDDIATTARKVLARAICFLPGESIPQRLLFASAIDDESDFEELLLVEDGLSSLNVLGLLQAKGGDAVVMHRLVAAAVAQNLSDESAQAAVEAALLTWLERVHRQEGSYFSLQLPSPHLQHITDVALERGDLTAAKLSYIWGQHLFEIADYALAERYLDKSLLLQQALLPQDHPDVGSAHRSLGVLARDSHSNFKRAQEHIEAAVRIHELQLGELHLETAASLYELGLLFIEMGNYAAAQKNMARSLAIREELLDADSAILADSHSRLGAAYWFSGDYTSARPHFETALRMHEQTLGVEHSKTAISYHSLGALYLELGDYQLAQANLEEALRIGLLLREPNHPLTALHRNLLGHTYRHLGNYDLAKTNFEESLAAKLETLGPDHPSTAATMNGLGDLLVALGAFAEAYVQLQGALTIRESAFGADNPAVAKSLSSLGTYYLRMGNLDEAQAYLDKALAIREKETAIHYAEMSEILTKLGEIFAQRNDFAAAHLYLTRALSLHDTKSTPQILHAETLVVFADFYAQTEDASNAVACYKKALAIYEDLYGGDDEKTAVILQRLKELQA